MTRRDTQSVKNLAVNRIVNLTVFPVKFLAFCMVEGKQPTGGSWLTVDGTNQGSKVWVRLNWFRTWYSCRLLRKISFYGSHKDSYLLTTSATHNYWARCYLRHYLRFVFTKLLANVTDITQNDWQLICLADHIHSK